MSELVKEGEALAVAVSFERVLEDGQRLSFGTAFAIDCPTAQKNRIIDELADLATRQSARARRPRLLAELRKHETTLAQFREDAARAEANWPLERQKLVDAITQAESEEAQKVELDELQAQIAETITVLQTRRAEEFNAGFEDHRRSGRGGEYKPRGNREVNLTRIDAQIKQAKDAAQGALEELELTRLKAIEAAKAALQKAEAEREVAIANYEISVKRYTQAVDALNEELAEIDELLKD